MELITFSWPPSSWKTSVIMKLIKDLLEKNIKIWVVKLDCISTKDDLIYKTLWIPVKKWISANMCPDHFFVSNIEDIFEWWKKENLDILITESAWLCNRCSPYIKDIKAICVIDNLSWINTPDKIWPMLKLADIILITKWDIVSQLEREVFYSKVQQSNSKAYILNVNWLNWQWINQLSKLTLDWNKNLKILTWMKMRFSLPTSICSYCLGETKIWKWFQMWNIKKIKLN